jgi:cytoskeletal protein RodZ
MPSVSEQFRAARERQRRTIPEVAESTNIKGDHIRALEAGRWEAFGAPAYIRGFARNYAKELRLDVPRIMTELEAELGMDEKLSEPPSLTGPRRGPLDFVMLQLSRIRWQWAFPVALGAIVVLVAWIGFRSWTAGRAARRDAPASLPLGSPLFDGKRTAGGGTLPLPTNAVPQRNR